LFSVTCRAKQQDALQTRIPENIERKLSQIWKIVTYRVRALGRGKEDINSSLSPVETLRHTELLADGAVHTFRLFAIAKCAHAYAHSGGAVTYRSEPQFDRFPIGLWVPNIYIR
jgi:hypothetical protein